MRILFVDFSSAFNTIIQSLLKNKLTQLSVPTSICQWINSFLTDRQTDSIYWGLENTHPAPVWSALELLRAVFSPHCSSPCTPTTAHLKTVLSSSWSFQMSPKSSASFRTVTSLLTEVKELAVWCSLKNLELKMLKTVEMIVDFRRNPPCSPPTHNHDQHCDCSGVRQIPGHHNFSGPEVGHSHWVHGEKGPAEVVLPSPAEKVQPATGSAETVLLCHHWIRPLHINNCLVQLSYQIWPQKTTKGSPDCWANHWFNPPHSPRTVLIQIEQKGCQNHSGPLTSSTLILWTVTIWSTLQSCEHQNDQKQFLPSGNPSHEHLTITWNTQHYYTSFINHTYLFTFQICTYHTCTYIIVCYILCFCFFFVHCLFCIFVYYYFYYLCPVLLLCFCCTVELLSL